MRSERLEKRDGSENRGNAPAKGMAAVFGREADRMSGEAWSQREESPETPIEGHDRQNRRRVSHAIREMISSPADDSRRRHDCTYDFLIVIDEISVIW